MHWPKTMISYNSYFNEFSIIMGLGEHKLRCTKRQNIKSEKLFDEHSCVMMQNSRSFEILDIRLRLKIKSIQMIILIGLNTPQTS